MLKPVTISCPVYSPTGVPSRRAGYDAAKTHDENRKHWRDADSLAPTSLNTPGVRATIRDRTREEARNNGFLSGMVRTLVNDTVGRGVRLQMLTPDKALNQAVEDLWREWAAATDWPLTTRVMCGMRYLGGEGFGVFADSKRLARLGLPVTLDVRLIEPDQVADPAQRWLFNRTGDDGIVCDADGEVTGYRVLKSHPGDNRLGWMGTEADTVPAANVVHWYQPERPGQLRGITPFAPVLGIFAQLRRFTMATLTAAEVAAMLAGVLELPDSPHPGNDDAPTYETMDTIELVRGMLLTVPGGGRVTQFKPEQPTTGYDAFLKAKLKEAGRPVNMPIGKVMGDHSDYNFSSGRLDYEVYWADRDIERQSMEVKVFNPVFYRFCDFARFAIPRLAAFQGQWWQLKHAWQYDARPTSDPVKDATGDELNLTNGTDTLADIAAREGMTEDELLDKRAETLRKFQDRGLPLPPWLAGSPAPSRPGDGQPQNPADARGAEVIGVPN